MKATRKLIPTLALLLISAIMLSTASYAWLAMNTTVQATGMQIKVMSNSTFLLIGTGESENIASEVQAANKTSVALTVEDLAAKVYPSKPWAGATDAAIYTTAALSSPIAVTTYDTAAAVGNWITANSNDPTKKGSTAAEITGDKVLTTFEKYVIKKDVTLTIAEGTEVANNLTVTGNILPVALKGATPLGSGVATAGKVYYEMNAQGQLTRMATQPTAGADVTGKYEINAADEKDLTAVKVLVVTDNDNMVTLNTAMNNSAQNLHATVNEDLTDTTEIQVAIYIYYDGSENVVRTNNLSGLGDAWINLQFSVEVKAAA